MAEYKLELIVNGSTVRTITRKHPNALKDITSFAFSEKQQFAEGDTVKVKLTVVSGGKTYNIKEGKLNIEKVREF